MATDSILGMLKDIQPPEAAAWWPPAIGWWILLVLLIGLIFVLGRKVLRSWSRYRFRVKTEALATSIFSENADKPRQILVELNQLLKRWLKYLGQTGAQKLTGQEWLKFLIESSGTLTSAEKNGLELLANAHYQADIPDYDSRLLQDWALAWIRLQERRHG